MELSKNTMQPLSITKDPIPQLIWRISIPASMGMFFNTLFNFTDTYCAGLLGTDALAAISYTFPLFFLLIALASGLSQGTTALMANALGANDDEGAVKIFAQSLLIATCAGVVFSLVGPALSPWLLHQLGARGVCLNLSLNYMNVILSGGVFFVLVMAINSALSAQGKTRIYRNFLIAGFIANCVLNPLLIWGLIPGIPALGVTGIALATVIVQIGGCAMLWQSARKTTPLVGIQVRSFRPDVNLMGKIAGQSVPAALNMSTIALGIFVTTSFVQSYGNEAVAAVGIATRIEQIVLMPVIGMGTAMLSITGQNYGAGLSHRVANAWRIGLMQGVGCMVVGAVLLVLTGEQAIRFFSSDPAIIAHGRDYLNIAALTLAAYPILFTTVFMMQGLKRSGYGLWMGLYRQVAAPIIVFYLLAITLGWGLWGIWWGACAITWSAALFALYWGNLTITRIINTNSSL
jgi:putative MATE family efflux protein